MNALIVPIAPITPELLEKFKASGEWVVSIREETFYNKGEELRQGEITWVLER